ncbi:hypothetical protein BD560DRAFT_494490 [Blakeslea trispora]|nr:hypothetical protein BD560DRAFT_494490 [Blakeslea trispora]
MYQTAQQIADSLHEPGSNMELCHLDQIALSQRRIWELSEKDGDPMGHNIRDAPYCDQQGAKNKKMQVLGHEYRSRLTGRDEGAHIYAYRANNIETDDLEEYEILEMKHLRAGIIEYFFLHETDYHENGEIFSTKHCFAFVSWYKNPRINIDNVETGTTERIRPFRKEYERKSFRSILPVHKLYVPIHIRHSEIKHLFTAYPLTRRLA